MMTPIYSVAKRSLIITAIGLYTLTGCGKDTPHEEGTVLQPPQNFTIDAGVESATFDWDAVDEADGYFLEVGASSTFSEIVAKTDTTQQTHVEFSGLSPETTYYARLRAIHKSNPSFTSNVLVESFTTKERPVSEIPLAFPGAEGYGKMTSGGRGGKMIKVTSLADSGPGTLRAAIDQSGPRIIVFEVSGNIELNSRLRIRNGDVTIAGQTAPGDGICIQNYEVSVDADNVIIRFMRFRMGDLARQKSDALWGRYRKNVIIDHCSISWSIDETSSFYANQFFTMQYCIIAESLNKSFHEKDDHGYGGIWGGNKASFHHNLLAHHNSRTPRMDGGARNGTGVSPVGKDYVDYRNNVIYNYRGIGAYGGENGEYNWVNNYYKPGPSTTSSATQRRIFRVSYENDAQYGPGYGKFYMNGNYVHNQASITANNWATGAMQYDGAASEALCKLTSPLAIDEIYQIKEETAAAAYEKVLNLAGASLKRDEVDARIVSETRNGTATYKGSKTGFAGIIDSQSDVGGWPTLVQTTVPADTDGDGMPDAWETANKLDPNTPNANGRDLSEVYDNIEVYFNSLVEGLY